MEDHHDKDMSCKVPGLLILILIPIRRIPMVMIMIMITVVEGTVVVGMEMMVIMPGVDIKDTKSPINPWFMRGSKRSPRKSWIYLIQIRI
jgi:hypothetical protein